MSSIRAKKPVAAPAAAIVGLLAAVAVTALGAAAIRDTLVATGVISGAPWLEWLLAKTEVLKPADWMTYAGGASVLLGLWILVASLKPRRATHLAVGDTSSGVWIRRRDVARLATYTARSVDSVTSAGTKTSGHRMRITATTFGDANQVHDDLTTAITQRLHTITPNPRIRARVTVEGS